MGLFLEALAHGVTLEQFDSIIESNASIRSFVLGYLAEHFLNELFFKGLNAHKYPDSDRKNKGDTWPVWKGYEISFECKCIKTSSFERTENGWKGLAKCTSSDHVSKVLPNGEIIECIYLLRGEFDILAIATLLRPEWTWHYAFIRNKDLPHPKAGTKYGKKGNKKILTEEQVQYLIASHIAVEWPLKPPFRDEPYSLMDEIVEEKKRLGLLPSPINWHQADFDFEEVAVG